MGKGSLISAVKKLLHTFRTKWDEYLLEIIVITLGIIGAFALTNWNDNKKDLIKEQQLLSQLVLEFEGNLIQLDQKIELRKALIDTALGLLKVIDHHEPIEKDALFSSISEMWNDPTFDPIDNQLLNVESLQMIRNRPLRNLLTSWSSGVRELNDIEMLWRDLISEQVVPFFVKHGITRDVMNAYWTKDQSKKWMLDTNMNSYLAMGKSQKSPGVDEILNDSELEELLSLQISYNHAANLQSLSLRNQILETLKALKEEINR
jgi:hypothetical protein